MKEFVFKLYALNILKVCKLVCSICKHKMIYFSFCGPAEIEPAVAENCKTCKHEQSVSVFAYFKSISVVTFTFLIFINILFS